MSTDSGSALLNRRQLLCGTAMALPLLNMPLWAATKPTSPSRSTQAFHLLRQPDLVRVFLGEAEDDMHTCEPSGSGWSAAGVELDFNLHEDKASIILHAPKVATRRLHLRWKGALSEELLVLGDAWERSYGDLAWLPMQAERCLPWYCLLHGGDSTFGMGVATGASAFAFWQVDPAGVSLWLDVRSGGNGVLLGDRALNVATLVTASSSAGESAFETTRQLCRRMAAFPANAAKLARDKQARVLYGSNDWYYAYGHNSPEGLLRDADLVRELAPAGSVRPFTVIDDGYQDKSRFPDMQKLAAQIRSRDVKPGVWIRPLRAAASTKPSLLLPPSRFGSQRGHAAPAFDPTNPEALVAILDVVREACAWGYDLIKHDFSTFELFGQWGSGMGTSPVVNGWSFQDRSKTNAEIVSELYRGIRSAAGEERLIIGCNTVGHLAAGLFDGQRTGDDVSGRQWERTRRMGVNTLGFRLAQNGIFFAIDADCVPITRDVPWSYTRQWLNVVANSGSVLLISPEPGAVGAEQKQAIRAAFRQCVASQQPSVPVDWTHIRTPQEWAAGSKRQSYSWISPEGASPFGV